MAQEVVGSRKMLVGVLGPSSTQGFSHNEKLSVHIIFKVDESQGLNKKMQSANYGFGKIMQTIFFHMIGR